MVEDLAGRRLDVQLLARELGNWRTSGLTGPAYQGLADGLRMLIVDGRLPVGAQLPSERALAEALRVSRTTVTAAYNQMRDDGYLNGRRGARSTTALPVSAPAGGETGPATVNLGAATLAAPAGIAARAFAQAADQVAPYLHGLGIELSGVPPLRAAIAERYRARGLPTDPDEIMVTSGALHAIGLILATYTQPGDRVLVEQPTYHGALSAILTRGARPVPVAVTSDGWELDAIEAAVRQLSPTLAYLIPDNQNPTGHTLPVAGRNHLARMIADTRTRTIIDETITDMWLDEPVPAPLAASMTARRDLVLTVGSMSKSFWGGLRIGWIRAERTTLATIAALRPSIDMGTAIVDQLAAAARLGVEQDVLPERRDILRSRRTLLLDLLAEQLPDWQPLPGTGGMSLWVRMPTPVSTALAATAPNHGVVLAAGPRFGVEGAFERFLRLPYAREVDEVRRAVASVASAYDALARGRDLAEPHLVV